MYLLADLFPFVRKLPFRVSRDQAIMLLTALMLIIVGVDIYFAHDLDAVIKPYEWIPIIFSPLAGLGLFISIWISRRDRLKANLLATLIMLSCVVVGVLGTYFHLRWTIQPYASPGELITVKMLIYGPPLLGPLTFILIALMGISAIWYENPVDSGRVFLWGKRSIQMPTSKTQAYFLISGKFILATVVSSVLDHSRVHFSNPWLWVPTLAGVFATVVAVGAGMLNKVSRSEMMIYFGSMVLLTLVGLLGFILHIQTNLVRDGIFISERFIRGAPFMAPLLFSNMGLLGLLTLLDPEETN